MKKKYNLLFIILSSLFSLTAIANPLTQVTAYLGSFTTYQASFRQWTINPHQQILAHSAGVFMLKRPKQFRWQTTTPSQTLVVSDGHVLWHYDSELMQATKQVLHKNNINANPALLLAQRLTHLGRDFIVSTVSLHGVPWFLMKPRNHTSYKSIYLHFSHGVLNKIIVLNNLAQRSLFDFSNIKVNNSIASSAFTFIPKKGVDINVSN